MTAREIAEAVLGLKVSRVYLTRRQLDLIDSVSQEIGLGISVGSRKHFLRSDNGPWTDDVAAYLPLESAEGWFVVYLADDAEKADLARQYDETGRDSEFGELLGIPPCCIERFVAVWGREEREFDARAYLSQQLGHRHIVRVNWRNNAFGQFFNRCLVSYFPCSLSCCATREIVQQRIQGLSMFAPDCAKYLKSGHTRPFLKLSDTQFVTMSSLKFSQPDRRCFAGYERDELWEVHTPVAEMEESEGFVTVKRNGLVQELLSSSITFVMPYGSEPNG